MTSPQNLALSAGCVLWRRATTEDGLEIALVHRP
ncbi:hypothetical protein YWIDRAFT_08432, partial [Streptomyces sp. SceaMP-e96]